jgi:two-component system response regulator NreC
MFSKELNTFSDQTQTIPEDFQRRLNILVVDDHQVVLKGTQELLMQHPEFNVIGALTEVDAILPWLADHPTDLILLDIHLLGDQAPTIITGNHTGQPYRIQNGLDMLACLQKEIPDVWVVMFSAHTEPQYIHKAMAMGARGYLSKTVHTQELYTSLLALRQDPSKPVFSAQLEAAMKTAPKSSEEISLTLREKEMLQHIAQGLTNKQIASTLIISVKTVDAHIANVMKKLKVNNRAQLITWAYQNQCL